MENCCFLKSESNIFEDHLVTDHTLSIGEYLKYLSSWAFIKIDENVALTLWNRFLHDDDEISSTLFVFGLW